MTLTTPGPHSSENEPPRIQPARRRRFQPAAEAAPALVARTLEPDTDPVQLTRSATDPVAPVHARARQFKMPLPAKPARSRQFKSPLANRSLPTKQARSAAPRLHPALQDIEQQETSAIPRPTVQELPAPVEEYARPEVVNGHVVLYRQANFEVYTVYRPGQTVQPLRKPSGLTARIPQVMPHQRERVAGSQTRRIPRVEIQETRRASTLPIPLWLEGTALLFLLLGTIALHAYNLFLFPAYTMDEGTYMQNAWAITVGQISPYPYGYGHPPAGWIQIAAWIKLSGLFSLGSAINSGRLLMLFYAAGSALLVYLSARRLSGSKSAALVGLVLFACSPLSVVLQREVLLDNIATLWLLLSLYLLVASRSRLLYLSGAALALGLAILSKEVLAVLLPAMIYMAWLHITPFQRKFALVTFVYITLAMLSTFVLMAALKGELFPYAWHLPWDHHPHLSLLDTYVQQIQRGQNQGSFLAGWQYWAREDTPLLLAGVIAPTFNLLYGWRERKHLALALLALSYWLLLVRGGVVYNFYLLPLIPLMALNAVLALHTLLGWLGKLLDFSWMRAVLLLILLSLLVPYNAIGAARQASAQPVLAQQQALTWIRGHLPHNAYIVTDAYLYLDLHQPGNDGASDGPAFSRVEVYWNVATDPAIRNGVLHNDWNNLDYIVVDDQMRSDIQQNGPTFTILEAALARSDLLATFHASDQLEDITLQIYRVRHQTTPLV